MHARGGEPRDEATIITCVTGANVAGDARHWVVGAPHKMWDIGALIGMAGLAVLLRDIQAKTGMVGNYARLLTGKYKCHCGLHEACFLLDVCK